MADSMEDRLPATQIGASPSTRGLPESVGKLGLFMAARRAFRGHLVLEVRFLLTALRERGAFDLLTSAEPGSSHSEYLRARPETLGVLLWPYQCSAWSLPERARRIVSHFQLLDDELDMLRFPLDAKLLLVDLEAWAPGWRICLEHPMWLQREGLFAISLFHGGYRAFSLAFSFTGGARRELFIGGLQGRKSEHALEMYKRVTKQLHGTRPRDLMIELVRILAVKLRINHILAVAEEFRYSHHPYFGSGHAKTPQLDYDAAWAERGGVRVAPTHFELPLKPNRRPLETVIASKRSQYRKRYEMLDAIEAQLVQGLKAGTVVRFEDY